MYSDLPFQPSLYFIIIIQPREGVDIKYYLND